MKTKKLSFFEALMLVSGAGIGTGMLTIPYAINQIGIFGTLIALVVAYGASAVMYLMIADLTLNSQKSNDLMGILNEHLFYGKGKRALNVIFFVVLVLLLLENLVVYIMCASDVLHELFGLDPVASKILFYLLSSIVMLFGIKGVGVGEKISVVLIGAVVLTLTVLSCFHVKGQLSLSFGAPHRIFAVYGLFMFAFSAIFSVIQVCNHMEKPALAGKAVVGGLSINAGITLFFAVAVILGSENITEIATTGLAQGIGWPIVTVICSVFVLLAMFSSYWSSGLAFADVIGSQLKLSDRWAWLIATFPTLIISIFLPLTVLDYVQIGAGALSVILVIVVIPAYRHAVLHVQGKPLLGKAAGSRWLVILMTAAICLMAVSSFIPID